MRLTFDTAATLYEAARPTYRKADAESFDLIYAATAWHWVAPEIRYRKVHRLLRPDGHLAFWSARHAFPAGFDPFFAEIQEVYDAIGEGNPR